MSKVSRLVRPADWPLAIKLIALCVAIAGLLAGGLSFIGYTSASSGLTQQAEAALLSDGQLTADAVDQWNARHLELLQVASRSPEIQRSLEGQQADQQAAQQTL